MILNYSNTSPKVGNNLGVNPLYGDITQIKEIKNDNIPGTIPENQPALTTRRILPKQIVYGKK